MADSVKDLIPGLPDEKIDMIAATSVLQQQAGDIRQTNVNWQSYKQSLMISAEDYDCISALDGDTKGAYLKQSPDQAARTLLNLLTHVSKDTTIQYILVLIDDLLQEDRSRVDIFHEYALARKENVWSPFLNLLNRNNGFIVNMASRILAKLACWTPVQMPKADLTFYLQFLKDQLTLNAKLYIREMGELNKRLQNLHNQGHHGGLAASMAASASGHHHHHHQQPIAQPTSTERYTPRPATADGQDDYQLSPLSSNEYIQSVARCLQMMLRVDEYRFAFVVVDGISTLIAILGSRVNFQVQYQLVFCLWVLTFNPLLAEKMNKFNVIPILGDILNDSAKEKVTRIILAVFRNLIEKPQDAQVAKEHCIAMVQCKVLKQLTILEQRKYDDEDISGDVDFLIQKLQNSVQDLSSFDEYATEIRSGRLEWSPVHKSAKFWRENALRLNEKNYDLLRTLIHLLDSSKDALVLSVASYDIGEYVRHNPRGKHVIEQLGGKQLVMQLLSHVDPNVRYEALLAVQKLMVHNWEYLGKQLEKDTEVKAGSQIAGKA